MSGYDIAISGIKAATYAFDVIGNNMANASSEGYHRQEIQLRPAYGTQKGSITIGGGVSVASVMRTIDNLLEQEILRQNSSYEQLYSEVSTMQAMENAIGEISSENGLSSSINAFFSSFAELSEHCDENDITYQSQVVSCANTMSTQFSSLVKYLNGLDDQIELEVNNSIDEVNVLIKQIADLNGNIEQLSAQGNSGNNLKDQRDHYITKLSSYLGVTTIARDNGVIDVSVAGIPVVSGSCATKISIGMTNSNKLGIGVAGTGNYSTNNLTGGKIGAYVSLSNNTIANLRNDLNDLASTIINKVNEYHVQGVGSSGPFRQLSGSIALDEDLSLFEPPLTDGSFFIRVTDTDTGQISRYEVDLSLMSPQTLSEVADFITNNVTGVNASYDGSRFSLIQSNSKYKFDFSPSVLPEPSSTSFSSANAPDVTVSGIYTGTRDETLTFTVAGTSTEVSNGTIYLVDAKGNEYNIGAGYAAGDLIDVGNGIKIQIGDGSLAVGDTFTVELYSSTDSAGFLSSLGLNTFFSGSDASNISVNSDIANSPSSIAISLGGEFTDNTNTLRLAGIADESVELLDSLTIGNFYNNMVVSFGQQLSVKQMQQDNVEVMLQNLLTQQGETSGIDVNTEAALMLTYEQMFQAVSRYLSAVQEAMDSLMTII